MKKAFVFGILMMAAQSHAAIFRLEMTNISARHGLGGQPMTPAAILVHSNHFSFFTQGRPSSKEVWLIAEDGDTSLALSLPQRNKDVQFALRGPRLRQGQSGSVDINIPKLVNGMQLSLVSMLSRTNDAFVGIRNVLLPTGLNQSIQIDGLAWDAGSEYNSESCRHIPCVNHRIRMVTGAEGVIQIHKGIQGIADLSRAQDGWPSDNKIANIRITRIQ